jgi:hypothetical protein
MKLISGCTKHLEKGWSLTIAGKKPVLKDVLDLVQRRIDAVHAALTAKAAWKDARDHAQATNAETDPIVSAVRQNILTTFSGSSDTLADFGVAPKKERRLLAPEELVLRKAKASATREARHTTGKRKKQAIHGTVAATPGAARAR